MESPEEQQHNTSVSGTHYESVLRWIRKRSDWLLVLAIFLAWPYLQGWFQTYYEWATGDPQEAAAKVSWISFGNVMSKVVVTILVMAIAYGSIWIGMKKAQPGLADWAKDCFTTVFKNDLDAKWQFLVFSLFWLVPLVVFALIFLGASVLA